MKFNKYEDMIEKLISKIKKHFQKHGKEGIIEIDKEKIIKMLVDFKGKTIDITKSNRVITCKELENILEQLTRNERKDEGIRKTLQYKSLGTYEAIALISIDGIELWRWRNSENNVVDVDYSKEKFDSLKAFEEHINLKRLKKKIIKRFEI